MLALGVMDGEGMFSLARASKEHTDELYALLRACSNWLCERGIAQWEKPYPRERFEREIAAGAVWFWREAVGIEATVTVLATRPEYYPSTIWPGKERTWYLCRFAVARRAKGKGVGDRLLAEVEANAAAAGIEALRLDVVASNPFLTRYYEARGFTRVSDTEARGGAVIFLEKLVNARRR